MAIMNRKRSAAELARNKAQAEAQQYGRGKKLIDTLTKQYDAKRGGYVIPSSGFGPFPSSRRREQFIESSYTPEQGGYYRDYDVEALRKEEALADTQAEKRAKERGTDYKPPKYRKSDQTLDVLFAATKLSEAKPYQRVHPSTIRARRGRKKTAAASAGRGGTVLTDRLGGASEDDKIRKRTLLGR